MPLTGDRKREYQRVWMQKRRAAYLEDKTCAQCGKQDRLQVDHIDPGTKLEHRIWSWSEVRRAAELAKCQILCEDCHKVKSKKQGRQPAHGKYVMYVRKGCRCDECKAWRLSESKADWERKKAHKARRALNPGSNPV